MNKMKGALLCIIVAVCSTWANGQQLSPRVEELTREAEACAARQDYNCCVAKYEVIVKGYPAASGQVQAALKRCRNEVAFGQFKARADGFFNQRDYSLALTAYEQALRYKTTNAYCLQRRDACRLELNFATAISKADGLFAKKGYAGAEAAYTEALRLKPTDSHSKERKEACRLEINFSAAKSKADGLFAKKDYAGAKTAYEEALRLKPADSQSQQRNEFCRVELYFAEVKTKADGLFQAQDYLGAQTAYEEALRLKPTDSQSQQRLSECQLALKSPTKLLKPASYTSTLAGRMIYVGGGSFKMGSNLRGTTDERGEHRVELDGFYMGETEVTVGQYLAFCKATNGNWPVWLDEGSAFHVETGSNSDYKDRGYSRSSLTLPVVGVSYFDALEYCSWLSSQEPGRRYGLPTEAQWEYAARGGPSQVSFWYAGSNDAKAVGWTDVNSGGKPHAVKGLSANSLGLYDMSGNVWEWCKDWYASDWYKQSASRATNAENESYGPKSYRVLRGGSWSYDPASAWVANRNYFAPQYRLNRVGFRVVASLSN